MTFSTIRTFSFAIGLISVFSSADSWAARFVAVPLAVALNQPVFALRDPAPASNRYWVVEKVGHVRGITPSSAQARMLLDLSTEPGFSDDGEQGLLGMALDPDFAVNHFVYFYVSSVDPAGSESLLVRYRYDAASDRMDPASRSVVYRIPQEGFSNHKGGMIAFGPDGHLYVGTGDGGSAGDPHHNAQNKASLLGKMLRFQVTDGVLSVPSSNPFAGQAGSRGEIWAYGLRNPWRFSFDRVTGQLWAGDVGQNRFEEIDIVQRGGNYGWRLKEGSSDYNNPDGGTPADYVAPVWTYGRTQGTTVIGGYVYRGSAIPELQGRYLFGDNGSSKVWSFGDGTAVQLGQLSGIVSFSEMPDGEILAISLSGRLYQLLP